MELFSRRRIQARGSAPLLLAPRFWIPLAISGFFLLMVFLLWRREMGARYAVRDLGFAPDYLTATWKDYDVFMWIERDGERLGAYTFQINRDDADGTYNPFLRARLALPILGLARPVEIALDLDVMLNERFELDQFQGRLDAAGQQVALAGFVEDLNLYSELLGPPMLVVGGGAAMRLALDRPIILADAIRPIVTQVSGLRVGKRWATRASDPISGRFGLTVQVEVQAVDRIEFGGVEVDAYRVVERTETTQTLSWYDADGNLLRTDLGNGLVLVADEEEAFRSRYPELFLAPTLEPLDRERIRRAAAASPAPEATRNLLPWLPKL